MRWKDYAPSYFEGDNKHEKFASFLTSSYQIWLDGTTKESSKKLRQKYKTYKEKYSQPQKILGLELDYFFYLPFFSLSFPREPRMRN